MSETTDSTPTAGGPTPRVSMRKQARTPAAQVEKVPVPPTVWGAAAAAIVAGLLGLISGVLMHGASVADLTKYLRYSNSQAKNPKKPYTTADLLSDVHSVHSERLLQGILFAVVLCLIAMMLVRTRVAGPARWGLVIIAIIGGLPFEVLARPKYVPTVPQTCSTIEGVASIVAIVLVFLPKSSAYFRACREATLPPERRGQPRPSLFGPRAPRGTTPAAGRPATTPKTTPSNPSAGKTKAKVRTDADAVAKGAELARSRAKASKSRRTDV